MQRSFKSTLYSGAYFTPEYDSTIVYMNVSAGTLGHEHYDNKTFPFHLLMEKEGPKCIIML